MTEPPRFVSLVPPGERPRRQRRASRVLLVDRRDRMLLFEDSDPLVPGSRWWMTPGGGIDPGESEIDAAVREVAEETGLVVRAGEIVGPIAHQVVVHGYGDVVVEQAETFFHAVVDAFEVDVAGHTEEEQLTVLQHRWWTRTELEATADWVWPPQILELWELVGQPSRWPVDLGRHEQSTVPVEPESD